ncbi:FAD-dependent oxidoreductase, partial [Paraburkholderia sp. SIMBA_009]
VPGYLTAANTERDADALKRWRDEAARRFGYERLHFVEADALGDFVQSARYRGGLYDPDSGHQHPLNYTLGLARAATDAGVRIHED